MGSHRPNSTTFTTSLHSLRRPTKNSRKTLAKIPEIIVKQLNSVVQLKVNIQFKYGTEIKSSFHQLFDDFFGGKIVISLVGFCSLNESVVLVMDGRSSVQ